MSGVDLRQVVVDKELVCSLESVDRAGHSVDNSFALDKNLLLAFDTLDSGSFENPGSTFEAPAFELDRWQLKNCFVVLPILVQFDWGC